MCVSNNFVHLHNHTEYSILDGLSNVKQLTLAAAELGMPAIAITDHGNLFGAFEFYKSAKDAGIKPIIGMEGYYLPVGSRFTKGPFEFDAQISGDLDEGANLSVGRLNYTHMTMWAETTEGMHNLFKIASLASIEGQYGKWPRFDRDLLERFGKGIIATTGCPSGEVQKWLLAGNYKRALEAAASYRDLFGVGNFFVEIMEHGIDIEKKVRQGLIQISRDLGIPLVATNDLHYIRAEDSVSHDALLCVQTAGTLADPKRWRFESEEFYLKTVDEMESLFSEIPESISNTLLIAERCNVEFKENQNLLPVFDVPDDMDENSYLKKLVLDGLAIRFKKLNRDIPTEYLERADYELSVIAKMNFSGYFLVVADLISHAKKVGIRVGPGRGSAAGALIAWALGITELDPIEHGLLFERFLNPERISMPDIDIDFDDARRGEMIEYAVSKYGSDRVAQIITFGSLKAKNAIRDSARILEMPYAAGDELTKAMPPAVMGKEMALYEVFDPKNSRYKEAGEFRKLYESREDYKKIVDTARGLEGAKRQYGSHAAGVILSSKPLIEVLPLMKKPTEGTIITQWDMVVCEKLGLLKMDFLGLRNLGIMDDCLEIIQRNRGITIVLEDLPLDDKPTYELLSRGDTLGVFQLDGVPMRTLLRSLGPTSFDDIAAVLALYRPGPMGENAHNEYADRKNNRKKIEPLHPDLAEALEPILKETCGLTVYQEQVMAIAQQLAGYTLAEADLLRKAMGKKDQKILKKERVRFEAGMKERGFSDASIDKLWSALEPFADYAFNKSHAAAYGLISYWTAYLKANYSAEYMAALLTSVKDDRSKLAVYLAECRKMGIEVLQPDINESYADFTTIENAIRFGLSAIRNVGANVVQSIVETRESKGTFTSYLDFLSKVETVALNKRLNESLIKAGAFDSLGQTRKGLTLIHSEAIDITVERKREKDAGFVSLFGDDVANSENDEVADGIKLDITIDEWDRADLLTAEREMLGLYVSDHPLRGIEHIVAEASDTTVVEALDQPDGMNVTVAGLIREVVRKTTRRNGSTYANITLEDVTGDVEIVVFSNVYAEHMGLLTEDSIVSVSVRVDKRESDVPKLIALSFKHLDVSASSQPVVIKIVAQTLNADVLSRLKEVLHNHAGATEVQFRLINGSRVTALKINEQFKVDPTPAFFGELKALLGPNCL